MGRSFRRQRIWARLDSPLLKSLLTVILTTATIIASSHSCAERLRVAVAANFYPAMTQLVEQFQSLAGNELIEVELVSGSSGKLAAQILHGAPFDLFLSADMVRPLELEKRQALVAGTRATYALGQLAVLSRSSDDPLMQLQDLDFRRIAIANPRLAPYGQAALETMQSMAVELERDRLVYGENISQTYHFFQTGHVDLALVAYSQIIQQAMQKSPEDLRYRLVPSEFYRPIQQQMGLVTDTAAAMDLYRHILSEPAQRLIGRSGYRAVRSDDKQGGNAMEQN